MFGFVSFIGSNSKIIYEAKSLQREFISHIRATIETHELL